MSNIKIHLDKDAFALDGARPYSTSQITGYIQSEIVPSWNIQLQLIGTEQVGKHSNVIVDDTFHLSNLDWILTEDGYYQLPFTLTVPNNLPISFHIKQASIYYVIQTITLSERVIQPIEFYKSYQHHATPTRLFWGIAKESNSKWQYELEFPSAFDLSTKRDVYSLSLRLRSTNTTQTYCLVTCQIIQTINLKGYKDQRQTLTGASELLKNPNRTWIEPCFIEFDLAHPMLLPTVNQKQGDTQ